MRGLILLAVLAGLAFVLSRPEPSIRGSARVVDGDTFWIGDVKIRVFGIDAPEASDPMGPSATRWLARRLDGQDVTCARRDVDRYGRVVAQCSVSGTDIASEMTRAGLARAYRRFSTDYVSEEEFARAEGLGIWSGATPAAATTRDCAIKGNIGSGGNRVYHMPGSRSYANTRIDTSRGERWFCSEAAARAAGWRAAGG